MVEVDKGQIVAHQTEKGQTRFRLRSIWEVGQVRVSGV